jgi:hypothetical protein
MRILEGGGDNEDQFRRLLDEQNDWPDHFTFKFIVPIERFEQLQSLLTEHEFKTRPSSKGNYVSVTLNPLIESTDEVIELYTRVSVIEGLVAL